MDEKKQIEEMARVLCGMTSSCNKCVFNSKTCYEYKDAEAIYNADYRKQIVGEWEWFEEWSQSTPEHLRECDDCGWRCGRCKVALEDMVGGYWDDASETPKLPYCPNCGARMKGV